MDNPGKLLMPAQPEVLLVPREHVRPFVGQPRSWFDQAKLRDLGENIAAEGQITPALARRLGPSDAPHQFELIDGERRWHATGIKKLPYFKIQIDPDITTLEQQFKRSVIANYHREEPTCVEAARSIDRLLKMGIPKAGLTNVFGRSIAWIQQHHSLLKLEPTLLAKMDPSTPENERLSFQIALLLVNTKENEQLEDYAEIIEKKLSMAQARHLIERRIEASGSAARRRQLPKKRFDSISRWIKSSKAQTNELLTMSNEGFTRTIVERSIKDQDALVADIEDLVTKLMELRTGIRRVIKRSRS